MDVAVVTAHPVVVDTIEEIVGDLLLVTGMDQEEEEEIAVIFQEAAGVEVEAVDFGAVLPAGRRPVPWSSFDPSKTNAAGSWNADSVVWIV